MDVAPVWGVYGVVGADWQNSTWASNRRNLSLNGLANFVAIRLTLALA